MEAKIKLLKISLVIEMVLGLCLALFIAFVLGVMFADSPSSTGDDMALGGTIGFIVIAIPSILIPSLSFLELKKYRGNKILIFNFINSTIVLFFVFFPLAIFQFYILYKLSKSG